MPNLLHIYIIVSEAGDIFSKMYSEYAENVYNVERSFRPAKNLGGRDWKLWGPKAMCLDKTDVVVLRGFQFESVYW